jgi:HSP20 family protein
MVNRYPAVGEFISLRDAMDRLVTDAFSGSPFRTLWSSGEGVNGRMTLPLDVYSTADEIVIIAAVPGIRPEDIELTINKSTVTLTGTMPNVAASEEAKDATWYLHELSSGTFTRSVTLPVEVDAGKADASFEHGVLRLTLPKAEAAKPRKIEIRTGGREAIPAESEPAS